MGVGVGNGGLSTNTSTAGNSNINNMTTSVQGSCGAPSERNASLQERISGVGGCQSSSTGAVLTSANSVASSSGGGGGVGASSSSIGVTVGGSVPGMGSPIRGRGCPTGLPASMIGSCGGAGDSMLRKSRSQGGKKLQKCLSTASYGEESSLTRPQMTPPSHNLLVTRQYCSFGSTTSNSNKVFFFGYVLFGLLLFFYVVVLVDIRVVSSPARYQTSHDNIRSTSRDGTLLLICIKESFYYYLSRKYQKDNTPGLLIDTDYSCPCVSFMTMDYRTFTGGFLVL